MSRAYLAITAFLVGPGCAWMEPKVVYQPFKVEVPIEVPCAAQVPAEPAWATKGLPRATEDNFDTHVKALASEKKQREGYEEKLKAAVKGCQ